MSTATACWQNICSPTLFSAQKSSGDTRKHSDFSSVTRSLFFTYFLHPPSIDKEKEFVELSLLPADTGKPDVLPESLDLPLRLTGEQKQKHDLRQKRKRQLSEGEQVWQHLMAPFCTFHQLPVLWHHLWI